ncbi:MotA/TolQ/ExbB proton channel family protein [Botrimarina colliarenosi]|uniref:MotA/TolQ/ExbB proton channel family protein n=1 Tax=Botrimarina colliarenosi TaxID=2528001 RepID=A0A5C6AMV2_9BACT|nr:MotA/TolQ/ExbB proton channel family protein [Botrimarina colliarenosi]TWU00456.1 MotA/TolQ/ExbB proton channel family protein [Botrimarina colliarenosi]
MERYQTAYPPPGATPGHAAPTGPVLSWRKSDIERRLAFPGARHTAVSSLLSFVLAVLMTVAFYLIVAATDGSFFAEMFELSLTKGHIPLLIVFFFNWSIAILFIKWRKLVFQRKALTLRILPDDHFVVSPSTVDDLMARLYRGVDDPRHFVVLNRIQVALSNLKNLGRVTDVDEILRSQAENDELAMDTSYSLLKGFVWAIPVLGFIGTVLGLSQAIGGFGNVLSQEGADMTKIASELKGVTGGLSVAFETTLQGLVAALTVQMLITFLRKSEEEFLDATRDYCHRNIVNRLRMTPFETAAE